jgi:CRISPR/Cas system-associated exonuclease Cas4 (RecB family)
MSAKNELRLCDKYSAYQDYTSLLGYIYYLRLYKLTLEEFLDTDMKEIYYEQFKKTFEVPLNMEERLRIEEEIRNINKRLNEYQRFNSTRATNPIGKHTEGNE